MTDQPEPSATIDQRGHPLYGLTVPLAEWPRYHLTPAPQSHETQENTK